MQKHFEGSTRIWYERLKIITLPRGWSSLPHGGIEIATEEEGTGGEEEGAHTGGVDHGYRPEGGTVADELRDDAANEDAQSHTDVPGDEDGAVGGATLVVRGHVDGHILEGGPHMAVA